MKRLTTRSRATAEAIRDREDFRTSGSLYGESTSVGSFDAGRLSGIEYEQFINAAPFIRYCVFSYATPIAWWTENGGWHRVSQKFSPTTTKHQSNLYLIDA